MDPFKILNVAPDASDEEVKKAYRLQAAKYHPDAGGDAWVFQQVREAYERILKIRSSPVKPKEEGAEAAANSKSFDGNSSEKSRSNTEASSGNSKRARTDPLENLRLKIRWFLTHPLPLQNETTTFILVNVLDIFMTYLLLRVGGIESNPIADYFFRLWNVQGLIAFKMFIVALVSVLAQVIARRHLTRARQLLILGTIIVGIVVIYSVILFARIQSR